ncbi:MAG: replication initiation protein [Paraburkholderia tropica]|uniref:Replication initiator protein n=1 Tax=Paraburkholderia tropica TaxID=92647 RepID=A0ABX5MEV7_9BURK|nr:replication initiation protein [Paraburkholderia tropica]MDE1140356.1 replication initiation protein [Paraburkholderia tropica]PXX05900.1 replication initiator protein [Paraburkholderia tropica]PZW71757.1 replication initiator protein [Paraburkholderia tropica]
MARKKADAGDADKQGALVFQGQPPDLFRKAVPAIHIAPKSGSISLQQRKMFSSLIKNAIRQDSLEPGRSSFEITISALSQDVDLNSNNTEYVKETINSLISTVVNWDYLTQDKRSIWKASGLLAGAELERSVLRYTFSEQIRGELLNPEIYAMIDMRITRQFRKAHSLALWENVVRYEAVGVTARFPLATLRDLILGQDTSAQSYKLYKQFKSRVLVPCIKEVNEISDHNFELIEHKVGRSVVALQFRVTRKPETDPSQELRANETLLIGEMSKFSIPVSEARRLFKQYGEEKIRTAVAYTAARVAQKNATPLANVAAYFRKALMQGYELPGANAAAGAAPDAGKARESQDQVKDRYIAAKINEARSYFNELEYDDQTALIKRYNETVGMDKLKVSTSKVPSKMASTNFFRWVVLDTWGQPTATDLLEFLLSGQQGSGAGDTQAMGDIELALKTREE